MELRGHPAHTKIVAVIVAALLSIGDGLMQTAMNPGVLGRGFSLRIDARDRSTLAETPHPVTNTVALSISVD
jgi:hypothetical protein